MSRAYDMALRLRRWLSDDQTRALVRVDEVRRVRDKAEHERVDGPAREMSALSRSRTATVCLGSACDSSGNAFPVSLSSTEARSGGHWAVTGTTGCGKSYFAASVLLQLIRDRQGSVVLVDMKGELAKLVRETLLPAVLATAPEAEASELLRRLVVIAPFDEESPPPFQLLARDVHLPIEVQAHEVSKSFGRTIGRDLGVLQETTLRHALVLAIELGLTLVDVRRLLQDETFRRQNVERSTNRDVRDYFMVRFQRERQGSLHALLSRLDSLLMYPSLRRMLTAKGMLRFDRIIEDSITLVDMGGAPAGLRDVPQFLGQVFFQKLVRQMFARRISRTTKPAVIFADEFQELLTPEVAADFDRVLTLARSQKVFLRMLFQQAAQVEAVSPNLLRILRTNCEYQMLFKTSLEDARPFQHVLPVTGTEERVDPDRFPDPRSPARRLTADEERSEMLQQIPSMPKRLFWFWNRNREYSALLVRSPALDIRAAERDAARLPPALREAARRGVLAFGESAGEVAPSPTSGANGASNHEPAAPPATSEPAAEASEAVDAPPKAEEGSPSAAPSRSGRTRRRRPSIG
jgi:hypothetical protein